MPERYRLLPAERWGVAAVAAIAVAVRLAHVRQPMRHDEAYTFLQYASAPLPSALSDYTYPNNHLFHTLLVWLTTSLFGGSPEVIRLPAFLAGVLLPAGVYLLARRFTDRRGALAAMGLAAGWPALVLYSTNARGYSLIALAFVTLLLLGQRAIDGAARSTWLWVGLLIAAGTYTAPVMLYPAGAALSWIIVETRRRHGWTAVRRTMWSLSATLALAGVAVALAYLPAVRRSGLAAVVANKYVTPLSPVELVRALPGFAADLAASLGLGIPMPALAMLAIACVAGLVLPSGGRAGRLVVAASVLGWCTLLLFITRRPPPSRVWLFLIPLGCTYAGAGLALGVGWLARRAGTPGPRASAALAICLAAALGGWALASRAVFRSPDTGTLADAPEIARHLLATVQPGDRIVVRSPCDAPLDYYLSRLGGRRLAEINARAGRGRVFVVVNPRHLQTLGNVQAGTLDVRWSELRPDASASVAFARSTVHGFRSVASP